MEHASTLSSRTTERPEVHPTVFEGITAGIGGAATIAVFFLIVDTILAQPFWTPTALAHLVIHGEMLPVGAEPVAALVVGYSVAHVLMFVGFGLLGSYLLQLDKGQFSREALTTGVGVSLFVAFQAFIFTLLGIFEPNMVGALGSAKVIAANALAAIVMAFLLVRNSR